MTETNELYREMGIDEDVYRLGEEVLEKLSERFADIDRVAEYNQLKVLKAMQKAKVRNVVSSEAICVRLKIR